MNDEDYYPITQTGIGKIKRKKHVKKSKEIEYEDGYDENCYKDDKDREYLEGLTQIEREETLAKRFEMRENMKRQKELLKDKNISQNQKLDEQKMKGLIELSKRSDNRKANIESENDSNEEMEEGEVKDEKIKKPVPQKQDENQQKLERDVQQALSKITFTREQLENLVQRYNFKDIIINCYCKVSIPSKNNKAGYLLSQIIDVKDLDTSYTLSNGVTTKKYIKVQYGEETKYIELRYISNQSCQESEFTDWVIKLRELKKELPKISEIESRYKQIQQTLKSENLNSEKIQQQNLQKINKKIQNVDYLKNLSIDEVRTFIQILEDIISQKNQRKDELKIMKDYEQMELKKEETKKIKDQDQRKEELKKYRDQDLKKEEFKKYSDQDQNEEKGGKDGKVQQIKNKIRQYDQEMQKIDKELKVEEQNCEILIQAKHRIKEGTKKSTMGSAFIDGNNQAINKKKKKEKQQNKEQLVQERIKLLNSPYQLFYEDLQIKMQDFKGSQILKSEFLQTHNRVLPIVENIILHWGEPDDIINILKDEKK